jgi:hypothetical protein
MVRIGTWNLENLFQPGSPGGPEADVYAAKLGALAATITQMDPDILAVQEVGDPAALTDLANRVGGTWHTATADPDGRGIRVGFLSRLGSPALPRSPHSRTGYAQSRSTTPRPPSIRWAARH